MWQFLRINAGRWTAPDIYPRKGKTLTLLSYYSSYFFAQSLFGLQIYMAAEHMIAVLSIALAEK